MGGQVGGISNLRLFEGTGQHRRTVESKVLRSLLEKVQASHVCRTASRNMVILVTSIYLTTHSTHFFLINDGICAGYIRTRE